MKFSYFEIWELLKAWIAVALVFGIATVGFKFSLLAVLPFMFATAGIGFLFHELSHKFVAQHYGCRAEFRANNSALLVSLVLSLAGFVLLAPGGVLIYGANRKQHGRIALAGPLMNIILALIFYAALLFPLNNILLLTANYGFMINSLLALFNMIPFPPFDGNAVFKWNKPVFFTAIIASGILMYLSWVAV